MKTYLIGQDSFLEILYLYTILRFSDEEIEQLSKCLCLTPKEPTLFTIKLTKSLITEIDEDAKMGEGGGSFNEKHLR